MQSVDMISESVQRRRGFTLVEMLVVILIMSILMTAGAIGLGGIGGKGVSTGVAAADSMFGEARNLAVSKRTKARVLIAQNVASPENNFRRILVAHAATGPDGNMIVPESWILSSRGILLPDQTFFSQNYSRNDHAVGTGAIPTMPSTELDAPGSSYAGNYFYYEFNSEGIASSPGMSFVIGAGARNQTGLESPRITAQGKSDFGGFVIWRNGRSSVFRAPDQINSALRSLTTGSPF